MTASGNSLKYSLRAPVTAFISTSGNRVFPTRAPASTCHHHQRALTDHPVAQQPHLVEAVVVRLICSLRQRVAHHHSDRPVQHNRDQLLRETNLNDSRAETTGLLCWWVYFFYMFMLANTYTYFSWQVAYIGVVLHQHVLMDYNSNFDHRASTKTIVMHWKDSGEVQHRLYAPIIKLSQARHTKYS